MFKVKINMNKKHKKTNISRGIKCNLDVGSLQIKMYKINTTQRFSLYLF